MQILFLWAPAGDPHDKLLILVLRHLAPRQLCQQQVALLGTQMPASCGKGPKLRETPCDKIVCMALKCNPESTLTMHHRMALTRVDGGLPSS